MKAILTTILLTCLCFASSAQGVEPAPLDKAVVYLVRPSPMGAALNFHYYDGDQLIGRFNGSNYLRYECEPGEHLFWARSENRSFVEAELMAGNIYVIQITPIPGGLKAGVKLKPIDPQEKMIPKSIRKLVSKYPARTFADAQLATWAERKAIKIANGMKRYQELKDGGKEFAQLTADMVVAPQDFYWGRKRRN